MYVQQVYTDCLAEAAYYIESEGEAVVIDPLRDIELFTTLAKERKAKIKYIFETHFHADFVSGHIDMAKETGATIVYGPSASAEYDIYNGKDEEVFTIGDVTITLLHTPGHTLESSCYLLKDEAGVPHSVFTGDTVFVGDVGRPDLAVKSDLSSADLAALLYDSIETKIKTLPDGVVIYPNHGAGSACGKNMGSDKFTTIGREKQTNYALKAANKEQFVELVLEGQSAPPKYFFTDAMINKTGYQPVQDVIEKSNVGLTLKDIDKAINDGALIIDTRTADEFEAGFIPNSLNIGLDGQFASWFGSLIDFTRHTVLVAESSEKAYEAIVRLARIGYENVLGFIDGGIAVWKTDGRELDRLTTVKAIQAADLIKSGYTVLDIRNESEHDIRRVSSSKNIALGELESRLDELDKSEDYLVHCAGGYRSMIAMSILNQHGFKKIMNIHEGITGLEAVSEISFDDGICPSKLRDQKLAKETEA